MFTGHDDISLYHEKVKCWYQDNEDITVITYNTIIEPHSLLTSFSLYLVKQTKPHYGRVLPVRNRHEELDYNEEMLRIWQTL